MGRHSILSNILFFMFFLITQVAFGQRIYLLDNDGFKFIKTQKSKMESTKIVEVLLKSSHVREITPELAQEILHITWLVGGDDLGEFPDLFIAHMGAEVGYGVFAVNNIEEGRIVAEYTGEIVTDRATYQDNGYTFDLMPITDTRHFCYVDALHVGGGARFVQHLPMADTLPLYHFNVPVDGLRVATANTVMMPLHRRSNRLVLRAIRRIDAFEQVGYDYGHLYEWQHQPLLFDTDGNIVRRDTYVPPRTLLLDDRSTEMLPRLILPQTVLDNIVARYNAIVVNETRSFVFNPTDLRQILEQFPDGRMIHLTGNFQSRLSH